MRVGDEVLRGRHGDIPIRRYGDGPVRLVWLHGGAFSHGGLDMAESDAVARAVAEAGLPVVAVDYRRAPPWSWWREPSPGTLPGIRYPVPLDDVVDAVRAVAGDGPVALGGASAGACLAAAAALRLRDEGAEAVDALLLAYGTFHAALPPISAPLRSRIRGRHGLLQFRPRTVRLMNRNYAGTLAAMEAPYAFPGGKDLAGLPPALVLDADRDSLRASGEAFARELAEAGVEVRHEVVPESTHGFLDRPAETAFGAGIAVIRAAL